MALRGKQKIFVHEYLKDLNATQAQFAQDILQKLRVQLAKELEKT